MAYTSTIVATASHAIDTPASRDIVPACTGRTTRSITYPARYGGTRLTMVITAAAPMPNITCLRYGARYLSRRRVTAARLRETSACASRIGRATASAYTRSASSDVT